MTKTAIVAAGFIDLVADGVNMHDGEALLIENGRILGFEQMDRLADGVEILDFSTRYCVPGLIDTGFLPGLIVNEDGTRPNSYGDSVWQARKACECWLASGVTTAASMGAYDQMDFDLRRSIASGRLTGPRVVPALSPLVPAGAAKFHFLYGLREVSGPDEARRASRELIKQGADRIVVYADVPLEFHQDPSETSRHRLPFSVEELAEIVVQARQAGCFVHAQAISTLGIDHCLRAGVRSIGCAFGLKETHLPIMAAKGIALAPNLALGATIRELGKAAGFSDDAIKMVGKQRIAPDLLMAARRAGVEIICGTNTAFLAGGMARECLELHRAGLSAVDALRAATQNGARAVRPYVESGSFRSRHYADFLFVATNLLDDLNSLTQVSAVMIEGKSLQPAVLSTTNSGLSA